MKIALWGCGNYLKKFLSQPGLYKNDEIICLVDNNKGLWHTRKSGYLVVSPEELLSYSFDKIVICVEKDEEIILQLIERLHVEKNKIISLNSIYDQILNKMIEKYRYSKDKEINLMISAFVENGIDVWGNYKPEIHNYEVYRDDENNPFVVTNGKKIFYPKDYEFIVENDKEYLFDLYYEQKSGSPHLYIDSCVSLENAIIVDAGACEGNFAIRFVETAKKIYVIEPDGKWMECLKKTFEPYLDRVIFCEKKLDRYDSENTITLDSLLNGECIDFLKMDIEGYEVEAILGGKKTLEKSDAKCSICAYHKNGDEENIKFLLQKLGYNTFVSNGYMFFLYDENIFDNPELRRGIVYGEK